MYLEQVKEKSLLLTFIILAIKTLNVTSILDIVGEHA